MERPTYRRDNDPPPSGPRLRVIRLKANAQANFTFLGTKVHGFWTHYGSKTEPCTNPKSECNGCQKAYPSRWKGYIHCVREDTQEEGFLEVTGLGKKDILHHLGFEDRMRGQRLKVLRGKGDKTALKFMLLRAAAAEFPDLVLPDEADPEETLRALWEWKGKDDEDGGRRRLWK